MWASNAEWPDCIRLGCIPNVSTDTHDSQDFAEAICRRLEQAGFGGMGEVFPIRTWVEEVPDAPKGRAPGKALATMAIMAASVGVNMSALLDQAIGRARTRKDMGPRVGTNRMRRKQQGKGW